MSDGTRLSECRVTAIEAYVFTNKAVAIEQSYIHKIDDDSYYICIIMDDSVKIGAGKIKLAIHIGIPDTYFPDGYRDKVYEVWID